MGGIGKDFPRNGKLGKIGKILFGRFLSEIRRNQPVLGGNRRKCSVFLRFLNGIFGHRGHRDRRE